MTALSKIKSAGFVVSLVDGFIEISPSDKLTETQRQWLKTHKAEIISELKAANDNNPPMENWQKLAIVSWIKSLGGSDAEIAEETTEVLEQCESDLEARLYFLKRATELLPALKGDTRKYCRQCTSYNSDTKFCIAYDLKQLDDLPRHCERFNSNGEPPPTSDIRAIQEQKTVQCMNCLNWRPIHQHGKGAGHCDAGVMPSGAVHWFDSPKLCDKYTSKPRTPIAKS